MDAPVATPASAHHLEPAGRVLWILVAAVLALHVVLLTAWVSPLQLRLTTPDGPPVVQLRVLAPVGESAPLSHAHPPMAHPMTTSPAPVASQPSESFVPAPQTVAALPAASEPVQAQVLEQAPSPQEAASVPATLQATQVSAAAEPLQTHAWPLIPLGALPPSTLLSYALSGMDKGLSYHASGELRWQHNDTAYEMALTVRAFLLGSRHWRSVGRIEASGLAPLRFSDSWRNERAAHFDREQQRVVFSSNSTPTALQAGAQDQVSLYAQLAAALAGEPERFVPGTRLQVQTVTVRDAQPWTLTLDKMETVQVGERPMRTHKWVCQPRNQYEARVEFWVAAELAWLPVRILITQASGSYIDLNWRASEPLAPLAPRS